MNKLIILGISTLLLFFGACKVEDSTINGDNKENVESILLDLDVVYRSFQISNMVAFRGNNYLKNIFDVSRDTAGNIKTAHIKFKANPTFMLNPIYDPKKTAGDIDVIYQSPMVNNIFQSIVLKNLVSNGKMYNGKIIFLKTAVLNQYLINTDSLTVTGNGYHYQLKTQLISYEQYSSSIAKFTGNIEQFNGGNIRLNITKEIVANNDYAFQFIMNQSLAYKSGSASYTQGSITGKIMFELAPLTALSYWQPGRYNFTRDSDKIRQFGYFPIF